MRGRILAIDYGTRRIGLAVSDALGITAQGIPTLERTNLSDAVRHIQQLADEYSAELILLGNPLSHRGMNTEMSGRVESFADKLRHVLSCPVELVDERLTSAEAERVLRESGVGIEKRRGARDRMAATLLLQAYLDRRANEAERQRTRGAE